MHCKLYETIKFIVVKNINSRVILAKSSYCSYFFLTCSKKNRDENCNSAYYLQHSLNGSYFIN